MILRKAQALRQQILEPVEARSLYVSLKVLNAYNIGRFLSLADFQWNAHLNPLHRNQDCNGNEIADNENYNDEEKKLIKYFQRNEDVYCECYDAGLDASDKIRKELANVPKETRQWIRTQYGEFLKCGCFFHKSIVDVSDVHFPLYCEMSSYKLEGTKDADEYGQHSCVICANAIIGCDPSCEHEADLPHLYNRIENDAF